MLKDYFDHVYLINLKSRRDRLQHASEQCRKINLPFEVVEAINGKEHNLKVKPYVGWDPRYWNQGAAGLVATTHFIMDDAITKGYRNILIMEDDIEFNQEFDINEIVDQNMRFIPDDWHMIQFGSQHCIKPEKISDHVYKIVYAFCLHCYAVNRNIFEYYKHRLSTMEKQLDLYTAEDIQPLGKCYSFVPNLAFQKPSFSDIACQQVNYSFLKPKKKI
jgi:GR25 family glycosyltransferase involved in LPS biosynthesis